MPSLRLLARLREEARTDRKLIVTPTHIRQMVGNKASGYLTMKPQDFLALTCTSAAEQRIIQDEAEPLEQYNAWAKSGDNILPPWLEVQISHDADVSFGKVMGHEGRHRAAACIAAGVSLMPVFIWAKDGRTSTYKIHPYPDDKERWHQWRYIEPSDLPQKLIGQYQAVQRELNFDTWKPIIKA